MMIYADYLLQGHVGVHPPLGVLDGAGDEVYDEEGRGGGWDHQGSLGTQHERARVRFNAHPIF